MHRVRNSTDPVAGLIQPRKRHAVDPKGRVVVDHDRRCIEPGEHLQGRIQAGREHGTLERIGQAVGTLDGLGYIHVFVDTNHRAKDFFAADARRIGRIVQDRARVQCVRQPITTGQTLRTRRHGFVDPLANALDFGMPNQRPNLGDLVNRYLSMRDILLPGFLTSMFVGILLTNLADVTERPLSKATIDRFGDVALNVFLAMSMMAIQLWTLTSAAAVIMVVLLAQILLMTIFAVFIVFRVMGRDYHAVVIASGFAGLGLGATPVAIANMNALTSRYGPSPQAFLVVPLVGAFFLDLLNAGTIKFFIRVIRNHLL